MCSHAWHSQQFYALHKARADSLCARGASFGSHDDKPVELPTGCSQVTVQKARKLPPPSRGRVGKGVEEEAKQLTYHTPHPSPLCNRNLGERGLFMDANSLGSNFTSKTLYWSSSPYAPNGANAWKVNFNNGNDNANSKNNNNYVRLVRSGE